MSTHDRLRDNKAMADAQPALDADSRQSLDDWIVEATAPIVGDDFFQSLIELLATRLDVDTALLTQCPDSGRDRVETLALWHNGRFASNIEYDLAGTPCEQVIHDGQFCFLPEGVAQRFPEWSRIQGGVESFIGVPVLCPNTGEVLGHIAIFDRHPMPHDAVAESMFRIIALRAGAEIRRRQAEQARLEQEQLAQRRLHELAVISRRTSISELTSAITHEIRQPLTSIRTYLKTALKMLDRDGVDATTLHQAIEQSLQSVDRGETIIRRLRQWVDNADTRMEPVDTRSLIRETAQLLSSEIARVGAKLEIEFARDLPALAGDAVLLQQVVFNLMRNSLEAVAHREDQGEDQREDQKRENNRGCVEIQVCGDAAARTIIEVRDNGSGVPDALVENIFQPFSGTRDEGMGIGLSLCRSIIESHGGRMELVSPRDPTVFRITLPGQAAAACGPAADSMVDSMVDPTAES